jgi:hypothetical protein
MKPRNPHRKPLPPVKNDRLLFFGWKNTKWFITEVGNMYSSKPSYFSKKRIESGVAFIIGQAGMIMFLLFKYKTLDMTDFIMWASLEFAVGGYITYQIQRQRRYDSDNGYGDYYNNNGYSDQSNDHEHHDQYQQDNDGTTNGPI